MKKETRTSKDVRITADALVDTLVVASVNTEGHGALTIKVQGERMVIVPQEGISLKQYITFLAEALSELSADYEANFAVIREAISND